MKLICSNLYRSLILVLPMFAGCEKSDDASVYGTLERDRIVLTATASEIVAEISVSEGQHVNKGDVLLMLDDAQQQAQYRIAMAQVQRAKAILEELVNGSREEALASALAKVKAAEARFHELELEYKRLSPLQTKGLVSESQLDRARLEKEAAFAQWEDSRYQWRELANGVRNEKIQQARADVHAAEAQLEKEKLHLEDLTVRATRSAIVEDFPWKVGERVSMGSPVVVMLDDAEPYARLYVPGNNLAKYKIGEAVEITMDGVDTNIKGKIRFISSEAAFTPHYALHQSQRSRLMYLVEVTLANAQELPTGLPLRMALR